MNKFEEVRAVGGVGSGPAPEDPKVNKFNGAGLELEGRESVPQVSTFEQVHSDHMGTLLQVNRQTRRQTFRCVR